MLRSFQIKQEAIAYTSSCVSFGGWQFCVFSEQGQKHIAFPSSQKHPQRTRAHRLTEQTKPPYQKSIFIHRTNM